MSDKFKKVESPLDSAPIHGRLSEQAQRFGAYVVDVLSYDPSSSGSKIFTFAVLTAEELSALESDVRSRLNNDFYVMNLLARFGIAQEGLDQYTQGVFNDHVINYPKARTSSKVSVSYAGAWQAYREGLTNEPNE